MLWPDPSIGRGKLLQVSIVEALPQAPAGVALLSSTTALCGQPARLLPLCTKKVAAHLLYTSRWWVPSCHLSCRVNLGLAPRCSQGCRWLQPQTYTQQSKGRQESAGTCRNVQVSAGKCRPADKHKTHAIRLVLNPMCCAFGYHRPVPYPGRQIGQHHALKCRVCR